MDRWEDAFESAGLCWPLKYAPYRGQEKFFDAIVQPHRPVELVALPTGYGKTICQIMYAAYLIATGQVQHILVCVPRDNLRRSFVEEWHKTLSQMIPDVIVLNGTEVLSLKRYAQRYRHVVMIASYQQLDEVLESFCNAYAVAVIADEGHHLYDEGTWARHVSALRSDHKMYFTATRIRSDRRRLQDVPADPFVEVTIQEAQEEGAICKLRAIGVQFWLDVDHPDGIYRVTSKDLEAERIDFSAYEARRQLRYAEGCTSPLIEKALLVHNQKHIRAPYKHQMLWKAMSTRHADYLCQQINEIVGDDDFAHTAHIHMPLAEREYLLCRFRGVSRDQNGAETPIGDDERFPCLVQVDMAGEGYNNPYISTLVKADLTKADMVIIQLVGRILRINYDLPRPQTVDLLVPDDDKATIDLVNTHFDLNLTAAIDPDKEIGCFGRERDPVIFDIPDVIVIEAGFVKLYELNGDASAAEDETVMTWADRHLPGWRSFLTLSQLRAAYMASGAHQSGPRQKQADMSESAQREHWRHFSEQAVSILAGNVIRSISGKPLFQNGKEIAGRLKTAIHSQWIRSGGVTTRTATADDLQRKHAWVKEVNNRVMARDIPLWLYEAYHGR